MPVKSISHHACSAVKTCKGGDNSAASLSKRGDTIIEVMFAFAVFAFISVLTIIMMNSGVSSSERSLELVTARNELNAQAEALRFIHSSYISELTLPICEESDVGNVTAKCQQFRGLWGRIANNSILSSDFDKSNTGIEYPLDSCKVPYENDKRGLKRSNAFVINTRELSSYGNNDSTKNYDRIADAYISVNGSSNLFVEPTLNARILYSTRTGDTSSGDSSQQMHDLTGYTRVAAIEGIWVVAVRGPVSNGRIPYYDFYIETCWYGPDSSSPASLDTVIRLYNPENT